MTSHDWSDSSFDWAGLDKAIDIISDGFRLWRLQVHQVKEKFGTACIYMGGLGVSQVHQLFHPRACFSRWPKWLWGLDVYYGRYLVGWMNLFLVPLQKKVYRFYYQKAVDEFPHLRDEILTMADWQELVEGIHGYKHDDHWISSDSPRWYLQNALDNCASKLAGDGHKGTWKETALYMEGQINKAIEKLKEQT
jgi:hypothetical protein